MKAKRKRHDAGFKARVALGALKGEKTIRQIGKDFSQRRQTELLAVARSSAAYQAVPASDADHKVIRIMDDLYLEAPSLGSRPLVTLLERDHGCPEGKDHSPDGPVPHNLPNPLGRAAASSDSGLRNEELRAPGVPTVWPEANFNRSKIHDGLQ